MKAIEEFQQLLAAEKIRYFSAKEVYYRGGRDEDLRLNTDPPRELWPKILPTLKILDAVRARLGVPLRLTSIYRSPAYNRAIGGESASYHMRFMACDVQSDHTSPREIHAILSELRAKSLFQGGLGRYSTFIHVDTRNYNATW